VHFEVAEFNDVARRVGSTGGKQQWGLGN